MRHAVWALAIVVGLSGCSTVPLSFTPTNVQPAGVKLDAALAITSVTLAPKKGDNGEKRRIDAAGFEDQLASLWRTSLDDSLARSALFSDNSARKVNLSVRVDRLAVPHGAVVMHTGTSAHYELIDRATGRTIYSTDIESDGRVPGNYAFLGQTRARESVSRSVQNNIAQFLDALKNAQLPPR